MSSILIINANLATMQSDAGTPYGLINQGAVAIDSDKVSWCGPMADIPDEYKAWSSVDVEGRLVTPALIDCHTHLVFGGSRAHEFEMRLNGVSYEEIAKQGGGIASTVKATRETDDDSLFAAALVRVDNFIKQGVSHLEIKSGYGLTLDDELRMLRVARRIGAARPVTIHTSFLGAHCVPVEYKGKADAYINDVCLPALDAAHKEGLVDVVDGFCEGIAFSPEQIERVFSHAQKLGVPVKLHAEQISNLGGAALAAKFNALSADHLEFIDEAGVKALAKSGTVAVLLPGAYYNLREKQMPPIELFRKQGVDMAVATDCNPGSSPLYSILLAANMSSTLFRLTPEEALAGITRTAAKALGLKNSGIIAEGNIADLAIWDVDQPAELIYNIGYNPLYKRVFRGKL